MCVGHWQRNWTQWAGWGMGAQEPFGPILSQACSLATSQLQLRLIHKLTTHAHNSFINVYFYLNHQMNASTDGSVHASQGTDPLQGLA